MRFLLLAIWLVSAFATSTGAFAQTGKRVALVIGNADYRGVPRLINPTNDAQDIELALKRLGFSVTRALNANYDLMRRSVGEFTRQAQGSEMAVVFYAGHGMEIAGENWLIPTDAELQADTSVETEAISLRVLMLAVSNSTSLGLVVLDACRNNPFIPKMSRTNRSRAVDRGFVKVEPSDNVLVVYSAKDGTTAADGSGRNSPFTKALLDNLETPGLEIMQLFRTVRDDVMTSTRKEQQPFVYGSLSKRLVYLKPPAAGSATLTEDEIRWRMLREAAASGEFNDLIPQPVKNLAEARAIEQFLKDFPRGKNVAEATSRLQTLKALLVTSPPMMSSTAEDEAAWHNLLDVRSGKLFADLSLPRRLEAESRGLEEFQRKFPQSRHKPEVEARITELKALVAKNPSPSSEEEVAWKALRELEAGRMFQNMPEQQRLVLEASSIEEFMRAFPNSQHLADAHLRLANLEKLLSEKLGTQSAATDFGPLREDEQFVASLKSASDQKLNPKQRERLSEVSGRRPRLELEIPFEYNSATISAKAIPILRALGRVLLESKFASSTFLLGGHTDASGADEYNIDLSQRRAEAVKRLLVEELKVPPSKLIAAGFGKSSLKNKANPLGQENRRVEVVRLNER